MQAARAMDAVMEADPQTRDAFRWNPRVLEFPGIDVGVTLDSTPHGPPSGCVHVRVHMGGYCAGGHASEKREAFF